MHYISNFVVKIASRCNIDCTYCYEFNLGDGSWRHQAKFMSVQTAQLAAARIAEHASRHDLEEVIIGLHGGEPLLASPDRLEEYIRVFSEALGPVCQVQIGVQTNATLVTEAHVDVLERHGVVVGVSLDGDRSANDRARLDRRGRSTFDASLRGIELLKRRIPKQVNGILAVIDIRNDPADAYEALASFGLELIDFMLPLYHWDNLPPRPETELPAYGDWYWRLYQCWTRDNERNVTIRFLENIVKQLLGGEAIFEVMTTLPIGLIVINADGNFEGVDTLKATGSGAQQTGYAVQKNSVQDALQAEIVRHRLLGTGQLSATCLKCDRVATCSGGYLPHRYSKSGGFMNPSVFCDDLYWLIGKVQEDLVMRMGNVAAA